MANVEKVVDYVSGLLSGLIPKPADVILKPLIKPVGDNLKEWLADKETRKAILIAAENAESDFREKAKEKFGDDKLTQAVASFPFYNGELFQAALQSLPSHFNETFLATHISDDLSKYWSGEFSADQIQEATALYIDCLRIRLLRVNSFADIITRLAILRVDKRIEDVYGTVAEIHEKLLELTENRSEQNSIQTKFTQDKLALARFTIPKPVQDFTDRDTELKQLKAELLRGAQVVIVSGGGGVGKTELAHQLVDIIKGDYLSGRISIDLLGSSTKPISPEDVMRRLLEPFYINQKLPNDFGQLKGLYQQTFSAQKVLLLFDNAANVEQVRSLIPPPPSVSIVTSRQSFSMTEFGLKQPLRLNPFSPESSMSFLINASEKIMESPKQKIEELSMICGHLPLALRIAVSIINDRPDWKIEDLLQRLENERTRLQGLKRDGDISLDVEAVISLSYDLLTIEMQKLFRVLGVFPAQFWQISAADIWKIDNLQEVDDYLGFLVNHSLLSTHHSPIGLGEHAGVAYIMHDLTRLFAINRLLEKVDEAKETIGRLANQYLFISTIAFREFKKGGEGQSFGLQIFRYILPGLLVTWERMIPSENSWPRPSDSDSWLSKFPTTCIDLLNLCLPLSQLISMLKDSIEAARRIDDRVNEQSQLGNLGNAFLVSGFIGKAIECFEQLIELQKESNNHAGMGLTYGNMGNAFNELKEPSKAINLYEKAISIAIEVGDKRNEGGWYIGMSDAYADLGDFQKALNLGKSALSIFRELGELYGEGLALNHIGSIYRALGDIEKGIDFHKDALLINRKIGDRRSEGPTLGDLALAYADLGELKKAKFLAEQSIVINQEFSDPVGEGKTLSLLGIISIRMGDRVQAISYTKAAIKIFEDINSPYVKQAREQLIGLQNAINIEELIHNVIQSVRSKQPKANEYYVIVSQMARDSSASQEIQELGQVLQKILVGVKNPDLSKLPEGIANLIREEFGK
jgi:tetratricopeptide (TPR) repeat protein